jgi:hypothetical protein
MTEKSIEPPKANSKPDDLVKPKTKDGAIEFSEHDLEKVSGGSVAGTFEKRVDIKWTTTTTKSSP